MIKVKYDIRVQKIARTLSVVVACLIAACGDDSVVEEVAARPVRSIVIDDDSNASLRAFSGVSRSAQESRLSFKVGGTIVDVPVKVGDKIKAGTVIAKLDSSTYELQLEQAQATVEQSNAASRNSRAAYERTRGLYANNNASLRDLDASRANADSASAQLRAARKSLQLAELNLSYTDLKVDVDCVVDSIAIDLNENVTAGTEVARVNCSEELEIEVAVPESIIGDFSRGKSAEIRFDAIPDKVFEGNVIEVGVGANGVGSTFPVTVIVENTDDAARTGLAASVSFLTEQLDSENFRVPLSAIVSEGDNTYVYLLSALSGEKNIGIVNKHSVTIGDLQTGGVEITDGLKIGDRVVVAGVSFMREDLRVSY